MANNLLLASDSFTSGSLSTGWSPIFGLAKSQAVGSNPWFAEPVATSVQYGQIWTGLTWPIDHGSEVTLQTLANEVGSKLSLNVRMQSGIYNGYQADIMSGTVAFYVYTSGVPQQLGTTQSGFILATNDVLSFQAAGANLTLYQNNIKAYYFLDSTYPSGSPGFSQQSTVNITHSQVASWRGYSGQSQDGIWTKGYNGVSTLLVPIASELGGTNGLGSLGSQGVQNPFFIYEGNPQIYTSGNVYKAWFVTTVSGNANGVGYAESISGLPGTYVRYSGNPILNGVGDAVSVWPNSGIYYLYGGAGTTISLWTSTNGVSNWSPKGVVLTTGISPGWDAGFLQIFAPIYFDGTYLIAKYDGFSAGGAPAGADIGIASSVFPFTHWTKYSGNPVATNFFGCTQPYIDSNQNYYFWSCSQQNSVGLDPADSFRMKTSYPFTNWTNKTASLHHSQQYEGVNVVQGGIYPLWVFTPPTDPTKTYYYYESWVADSVGGEGYQFSFAYSTLPLSTIVQNKEDGCFQLANDLFIPSTGNLSNSWAVLPTINRLQIVSGNFVEATAISTNCAQAYSGVTFSPDQYSEVVGHVSAANTYILPYVRMQPSGLNGYSFKWSSSQGFGVSAGINLAKTVAGTTTTFPPTTTFIWNSGQTLRMSAVGNSPVVLTLYRDGYQILQAEDYNNTFTSGNPGLYMADFAGTVASAQAISWAGGNANTLQLPSLTNFSIFTHPGINKGLIVGPNLMVGV